MGFQGAMQYPMGNAMMPQGPVNVNYKPRDEKKQEVAQEKPKEDLEDLFDLSK